MEYRGSDGKVVDTSPSLSLYEVYFPHIAQKIANKVAKSNANRPFEIRSIIQILEVMNKSNGRCYYSGKLFKDLNDITFERIDPTKPYTVENVAFANLASNSAKSQLDAFEKGNEIPDEMKIKLLNKLVYRLTKKVKEKTNAES